MSAVFADSFYFLARLNPADEAHDKAVQVGTQEARPIVTTAWVLTEVGDAMVKSSQPSRLRLVDMLQSADDVRILPPTDELFQRGIRLYTERPDKEWSLTDCISFAAMTDENITDALTGDHHFEQAGFKMLV